MPEAATTPAPTASSSPVDEMLYEVIDGRIVEKSPMGTYEGCVTSVLFKLLSVWDSANGLGRILSEVLFTLDPAARLKLRPDLAYVSYERWPQRKPISKGEGWDVIPDLAIEVISPSNSGNEIVRKLKRYFRAGVRQVWVVYPIDQHIYVYSSPTAVQILQIGDELDGGLVLPGFRVAVSALFVDELADD
jgi:Uma2 family endonuclease